MNKKIKLFAIGLVTLLGLFTSFSDNVASAQTNSCNLEYTLQRSVTIYDRLTTEFWFEFGTVNPPLQYPNGPRYGYQVITPPAGTENGYTADIFYIATNLTENTKYYYRGAASNSAGIGRGAVINFTTPACPVINTAPVITLNGTNPTNLTVGQIYTEYATAYDKEDGNITSKIVRNGVLNTNSAGTYILYYNVKDSQGLSAQQVTRTVIVKAPVLNPTLRFEAVDTVVDYNTGTTLEWSAMNTYGSMPCTASGAWFGNKPVNGTSPTGPLTSAKTYSLKCYGVHGTTPVTKSVTVNVRPERINTAPVITLIGSNPVNLTFGQMFTDPGATAFDSEDGNITSKIIKTGSVNTNAAGTYTLYYNVKDLQGLSAAQVTRTVIVKKAPIPAPTATLTAFPAEIQHGEYSTLKWNSTNATACASENSNFSTNNATSGTKVVSPKVTTTYKMTCIGFGGSVRKEATITVRNPANPSVDFKATPNPVDYGTAATLSWSSKNATVCEASGAWSGSKGVSGTESTGNLTTEKTYTITCKGMAGTIPAQKTVVVKVNSLPPQALPEVDLKVIDLDGDEVDGPITIPNINDGATLTWTSKNAIRCETWNGSNGWKNARNWKTSGEFETGFMEGGKVFKITCYNSAGASATDSVRIIVEAKICLPTATLSSRINNISSIGGYVLTWNSTHADSCSSNDFAITNNAASGRKTVHPTKTTTYSIVCTGPGGSVNASTTIIID